MKYKEDRENALDGHECNERAYGACLLKGKVSIRWNLQIWIVT